MIKRIARRVRKENEKPLHGHNTSGGCYMREFATQDMIRQKQSSLSHLNKKVTMIGLPHFLLDDYHGRVRLHSTTEHPPLTLLQSESASAPPDRDLQQAVCSITGPHDDRIFYVSRLWCFILNDDLLVTCSQVSEQSLLGDTIVMSKEPTRGTPFIRVTDGGNCLWQLGLQECQTWLGFTSHFMEISSASADFGHRFEDHFVVTMNGRSVTSENWAKVLKVASERTVQLVLLRRSMGPQPISEDHSMSDESSVTSESHDVLPSDLENVEKPSEGIDLSNLDADLDAIIAAKFSIPSNAPSPGSSTLTNTQTLQPLHPNPSTSNSSRRSQPAGDEESPDHSLFRALHWAAMLEEPAKKSATDNEQEPGQAQEVAGYLGKMHQQLSRQSIYQRCPEQSLQTVTRYVLLATYEESTDGYRDDLSILDQFFTAAAQVFELFLPLDSDATVATKYWGSVYSIIRNYAASKTHQKESPNQIDKQFLGIYHVTKNFKRLAQLAFVIQYDLSDGRGPAPGSFALPIEFRKAWEQCLLYLARHRNRKDSFYDRQRHAEKCKNLLRRARRSLWKAVVGTHVSMKEIVPPTALLSVIIKNALQDVSKDSNALDIADVYDQSYKRLEAEVKSARMKRTYRARIVQLQQELAAVSATLDSQRTVIQELYALLEQQSTGWSSIHSDILDGVPKREMLVIQESIAHVNDRAKLISDITDNLAALETWVTHEMILTKDRHDNAIYAFTIVTVIFLPLSFVCSFLGMNTADVRNMQSGQWVFWAAAIPLTVTVVLLTLIWTDELRHLMEKVSGGIRNRRDSYSAKRKTKVIPKGKSGVISKIPLATEKFASIPMASALPGPRGGSTSDPWNKPYRRTPTFKSMAG
ncbi:cora-like Mg2+ transporter protein-domain-containing protein [Lophiotrema nucula]|uniref:Cora-like Mg2+ transporter protein-domain-containing protein n=1 Tax=Lophiotrema nucula TaxID=690887 RepID=A0A6A5YQD6_9PLEO|nr:cora-like Mg2+ transporter protein-domain-containing protein [Lophiotrema nucula]